MESNVQSPYHVPEGQTAMLKCIVTKANPISGLEWIWHNSDSSTTILSDNSTYDIQRITRKESGNYSCAAKNSVGTSEAAILVVDVQCKYFQLRMFYKSHLMV